MSEDMVTIPAARLKELEDLEASLPTLIEKARVDGGMGRLKMLEEKRKADPGAYNKRMLERYHVHKEEINTRRREARRLKREAAEAAKAGEEAAAASP